MSQIFYRTKSGVVDFRKLRDLKYHSLRGKTEQIFTQKFKKLFPDQPVIFKQHCLNITQLFYSNLDLSSTSVCQNMKESTSFFNVSHIKSAILKILARLWSTRQIFLQKSLTWRKTLYTNASEKKNWNMV